MRNTNFFSMSWTLASQAAGASAGIPRGASKSQAWTIREASLSDLGGIAEKIKTLRPPIYLFRVIVILLILL
jgi:hypothetical protein